MGMPHPHPHPRRASSLSTSHPAPRGLHHRRRASRVRVATAAGGVRLGPRPRRAALHLRHGAVVGPAFAAGFACPDWVGGRGSWLGRRLKNLTPTPGGGGVQPAALFHPRTPLPPSTSFWGFPVIFEDPSSEGRGGRPHATERRGRRGRGPFRGPAHLTEAPFRVFPRLGRRTLPSPARDISANGTPT